MLLTYLGKIKWIKWEIFCLLKCHDLDIKSPGGVVPFSNGIEQISEAIVGIFLGKSSCLFNRQVFDPLVSLQSERRKLKLTLIEQVITM